MEQALRIRLELNQSLLKETVVKALEVLRQVQESGADFAIVKKLKHDLGTMTPKFKDEILNYIHKAEPVSTEFVRECTELELEADKAVMDLTRLINEYNDSAKHENTDRNNVAKLPKLQLPTFDGDILKWHDFWDQFEASVQSATTNNALKMAYLVASLKGPALEAIEGLGSTNKNYSIAVETLRNRYGNKQYLVDAHYNALHQLECAQETPSDCRRVLNSIEKNMRVLQSLGENTDGNGFRTILLKKFPERVMFQLNIAIKKDSTVSAIREQLDHIIMAMELSQAKSDITPSTKPTCSTEALHIRTQVKRDKNKKWLDKAAKPGPSTMDKRPLKRKMPTGTENTKRQRRSCVFCEGGHYNDQCKTFKSIEDRKKKLSGKCFKCLKEGHMSKLCGRKIICYHCKGPHNRALCSKKKSGRNIAPTTTTGTTTSTSTKTATSANNTCQNHNYRLFLQTATARVLSKNGKHPCRILMDSGSQRSYMTTHLAKQLSITPSGEDLLMIYTFGSENPLEMLSPSAKITIETNRGIQKQIQVNIVPNITDRIPVPMVTSLDLVDFMADDGSMGQGMDILIGNDYYFSFITGKVIKMKEELYLADTEFGWILSGVVDINNDKDTLAVVTYHQSDPGYSYYTEPDLPLQNMDIKFLWTLENIGITDSAKTTREEEAIHHFNDTVQYHEGRYFVKWPWTQHTSDLPTNYGLAYGRLKGLLQRSDVTTLQEYEEILKEQCDSGIIEVLDPRLDAKNQTGPPIHYLPHHLVKQPGKRGRVVYDASAKLKNQRSLNECMYKGPCMLQDLTALLLNFRTNKIGILADVEKAFLQVGLQTEARDVTRFLWVKDIMKPISEDNLIHFRFCRVPFGIISSPFLLTATIRYHLSKKGDGLLERIADKCYVDNLVTGANNTHEACQLYNEARTAFQELAMNIRDWTSNDKTLIKAIPEQYRAKELEQVKVLGLLWNVEEDSLQLKLTDDIFDEANVLNANKREVLRTLASIYDPCGLVSPLTMPAKLLLQELWRRKCKWDTKLPQDLVPLWKETMTNLIDIKSVKVPRHLGHDKEKKNTKVELHCFTDASQNSYAAVAYLRSEDTTGIRVTLLMSKARVAPLKDKENLKIPRLELLGYLIGNRLLTYLMKSIALPEVKQFLWTDSLVVLNWMESKKLLAPFVARRVEEIKQNTEVERCYINTEHNPADVATRPETWTEKKKLWFNGPMFLATDKVMWPSNMHLEDHLVSVSAAAEGLETRVQPEILNNRPSEEEEMPQSTVHLNSQLQEIIDLQSSHFPEEFEGKETHLTRNLGVFKDVDGVLRCKGRLMHADLSYETQHPILLPKDCEFTTKIITDTHETNYHVGVPHTLSIIRHRYWIPQGRVQVRKVIQKCPRCIKHGGGPYRLPQTPALPVERVKYSSPFTYTGVDYFGPIYVRTTKDKEKRWICLFTCLVIRAIHLEVVQNLTAEECLLALRRFVASRGVPSLIMSDNALYFKLTSEVVTSNYCTQNEISWKFIPKLAPWHGGVYERLVSVVKHCLKRTLEKHLLGDNQLLTVLKEVETVVNTRPLTYVGADVDYILKPADFLSLGKCLELDPSTDQSTSPGTITKETLIEGWKRGQRVMKEFKNMFIGQYLLNLRERYRHSPKQPRVKSHVIPHLGDVVQIKGEQKNRDQWRVGRISELIKGKDGEVRVAKVRVGNTDFIRSIGHLYPLESEVVSDNSSPLNNVNLPKVPDAPMEVELDQIPACQPQDTAMDIEPPGEGVMEEITTSHEGQVDIIGEESVNINPVEEIPPLDITPRLDSEHRPGSVMEDGRLRRNAAVRAREKIAEWTQQLFVLL